MYMRTVDKYYLRCLERISMYEIINQNIKDECSTTSYLFDYYSSLIRELQKELKEVQDNYKNIWQQNTMIISVIDIILGIGIYISKDNIKITISIISIILVSNLIYILKLINKVVKNKEKVVLTEEYVNDSIEAIKVTLTELLDRMNFLSEEKKKNSKNLVKLNLEKNVTERFLEQGNRGIEYLWLDKKVSIQEPFFDYYEILEKEYSEMIEKYNKQQQDEENRKLELLKSLK